MQEKYNRSLDGLALLTSSLFAEHSIFIDVDNQAINRLWQECRALSFLLIYYVCALPTVFLYVWICWGYWYDH